jgi:zinc transport system permease protein
METLNIITTLREMFSYTFLVRAFVVGALVSVCAALLGVSLVLKRYSMIGDGLSHVGFGALALATALHAAPLAVAIPVVVLAAFLLLRLGEKHLIKGDAAIALISTSSLALGVVIISQTTGMNTDVCNYLFGSILAMNKNDVYLSVALSITVLSLFVIFYHKLFALTFDETFARATGVKTGVFNMLIAFLTAITIVLGMRMMGAMLISALIIFPALTSMRVFKTWRSVSVSAVAVSLVCYFTGIVISYIYAMPTGASVVLVNIAAFAVFCAFGKSGAVLRKAAVTALLCTALLASCGIAKKQAADLPLTEEASAPSFGDAANSVGTVSVNLPPAQEAVKPEAPKGPVIEIKEKMFIAQTNDVYLNAEDYMGKTLRLQGLFKREQSDYGSYCFVIRYGPGCCGNDGNAGFEVAWEPRNKALVKYPAEDDWVEATGVLSSYEEDGYPYLYLALTDLKVMDKRGAEYVTQ